jgi:hypothetical protein
MALNIKKIFTARKIDLEEERDKVAGHAHAHSRHWIEGREGNPKFLEVVDVEWEARDIHEEFTAYPPHLQEMILVDLLNAVPEPGDDEEIEAESDGRKRRGGVVIRLKPREGNIRLRITL